MVSDSRSQNRPQKLKGGKKQGGKSEMLNFWLKESVKDEPFHGLGAIEREHETHCDAGHSLGKSNL
jgi:hypothetical protein